MDQILCVALSQGMADTFQKVSDEMGVNLPIVITNQAQIQEVAQKYNEVDVYICRGKVAELLQKYTGKPVVELKPSINEILEPVEKLAAAGILKVAVVADPKLIGSMAYNFNIGVEILYAPCQMEELDEVINKLHASGVKGIVAGRAAFDVANKLGMATEMLDSGPASSKIALQEALKIFEAQENERKQAREKSKIIHDYIAELYRSLEHAAAAVEELAASSEELAATSQEAANFVNTAFQEVNDTAGILDIIRGVAKQTNLLGLNAAIEAARSGEYGRGFSVVATEVRKLADESNNHASYISDRLEKIHKSVEKVLKNVEQSNEISQEQSKANQDIADMLEGLRETGKKLMDMAENLSTKQ